MALERRGADQDCMVRGVYLLWESVLRGCLVRASGRGSPSASSVVPCNREWRGRIVRTEGEIDAKSRLVHVVARVENDPDGDQSPLPVGLFVRAEVRGRRA